MSKKLILAIFTFLLVLISNVNADSLFRTILVTTQPISFYFDGIKSVEEKPGTFFNGKKDVPLSLVYEETTYVPLRYVAEKLGKEVGWDQNTKSIWVGKKPTHFEPETVQSSLTRKSDHAFFGLRINQTELDVIKLLGQPNRVDKSKLGYEWWIYNQDYKKYIQVGIKNGKVVDLYSNAEELNISDNLKLGDTKAELQKNYSLLPTVKVNYDNANFEIANDLNKRPLVLINNVPFIFYIDKHNQDRITAIRSMTVENLIKSQSYSFRFFYTNKEPAYAPPALTAEEQDLVNQSNEKQIFDLTNVIRARYGLAALKWNENVANVARKHSLDMLTHNYFDHTSKTTGLDPFQRLTRSGITYKSAGENIAMGQFDAIEAHEGWMNSLGHRENILNKDFTMLGVGAKGEYYTQNFIRK